MTFEIWMEGFRISGGEAKASYVGKAEGNNFREAVINWYSKHFSSTFDAEHLTDWGCELFPSEEQARKRFG